ncbi:MAG: tRNA (N6-isopentenyl adenosine(37)-C2)-methylthiotransferase MiaB [Synergistaceae bacterium]|nr:tRNA (N6-isopentenyl adenosine(37)-C2)-methylthiotransferase MiaB [Synergistaceae bacterium]MDD3673151.1 tRNA (N6-isopentenyl adenosine(37)-C2)-methylthiotransferase MiaB [Synergistaceae bacterium]MDD3963644.1 tRNA (N6-isopentenyl adenosine(37)-C2)-methylthiotransferase MiaB [Synergistaceae bacterium]
MKSFAIKVFGCQMNSYDGDRIRTSMIHMGWKEVPEENADVIILVTCSIREKAEQKVASEIGRYDLRYRKTGSPAVALVGCMAQRIGLSISKKFQCVRLVSGPRHLGLVPQGIDDSFSDGAQRFFMDDDPRTLEDLEVVPTERTNPFKAYVTITYGCDRFCTYCIVPYVRGRLQSRGHAEIIKEAEALAASGVSEITLLGQNVDAYGKDKKGEYGFASLLKDVSRIEGIRRLRFATSHPKDFDEDILEVMAETPSICRAINLPVQSGSDRILKEMNRGYTRSQYLELVRRIRTVLPDVSLTTDLIVGFPQETEDDFRDSYDLLKELRFDIVHTAAYSPREGTKAAVMEGQIDNKVKAARLNEINALQSQIALELNEEYVGKTVEILLDGPAPRGEGSLQGRTKTDKVVIVKGSPECMGSYMDVKIIRASHWSLEGEII